MVKNAGLSENLSFLKKKKEQRTSILFATDLHGSEAVWRKFLNASAMLKVNVAICGGDLTGKMIVPVVEQENAKFAYYFMGKQHIAEKDEVDAAFKRIRGIGYYPYLTNAKEYDNMTRDTTRVDEVFHEVMVSTLKNWLDLIPQKIPAEIKVIVCPGNDDRPGVDDLINNHKSVINGENKVIEIDETHEMISCGWVNPSPWNTAREEDDGKLETRLENYISKVQNKETAIFNFHAPPFQTKLDDAPQLDADLNPVLQNGSVVMVPVGSKAVRKMIEKYQPFLGLHGHIHESAGSMKIGRTYCVNPGSEYAEGILRAFLIEFKGTQISRLQRIEG